MKSEDYYEGWTEGFKMARRYLWWGLIGGAFLGAGLIRTIQRLNEIWNP